MNLLAVAVYAPIAFWLLFVVAILTGWFGVIAVIVFAVASIIYDSECPAAPIESDSSAPDIEITITIDVTKKNSQ